MKKAIIFLTILSMVFNNFILCMGYEDTMQIDNPEEQVTDSEENENILTETGTTTVEAATKPMWLGEDAATASANASGYIAKESNTKGFQKVNEEFCGYVLKMSSSSTESYVILQDPNGAYFNNLTFYIYLRRMSDENYCKISVSDTLNGPFTDITDGITMEEIEKLGDNRKLWKQTLAEINAKYVKITAPVLDGVVPGGTYPVLGAFSYDWTKITDLSDIPDGTITVSGTNNPYWLADTVGEINGLFVQYNLMPHDDPAKTTVSQEDIDATPGIIGRPVIAGETGQICATGKGTAKYAVVGAPKNAYITRFKYYIRLKGETAADIAEGLLVSDDLNGSYTPVSASVRKLGYLSGFDTANYIYEIETAETIYCKYVKIQMPTSSNTARLGAFEYDYKIDWVASDLEENFYKYDDLLNGQNRICVEHDLTFPQMIECEGKDYEIEWISDDESVIETNGAVHQQVQSKNVKITANVYDGDSSIYSKNFDFTVIPIGSSVLFFEDFEANSLEDNSPISAERPLEGYKNWNVTNTDPEAVQTNIVADPSEPGGTAVEEANKVVRLFRATTTKTNTDNNVMMLASPVECGKVMLSFRLRLDTKNNFAVVDAFGPKFHFAKGTVKIEFAGVSPITLVKNLPFQTQTWYDYCIVLDKDNHFVEVYRDNMKACEYFIPKSYTYTSDKIAFSTLRYEATDGNGVYFDDFYAVDLMPDSIDERFAIEAAAIRLPDSIRRDLQLPSEGIFGSSIIWKSSAPEIIDNTGIVNSVDEQETVELTAILIRGNETFTKQFTVEVPVEDDSVDVQVDELQKIVDKFSFSREVGKGQSTLDVSDDLSFPETYYRGDADRIGGVKIEWTSDSQVIDCRTGVVSKYNNEETVNLTATFKCASNEAVSVQKTFELVVNADGTSLFEQSFDSLEHLGERIDCVDGVNLVGDNQYMAYRVFQDPTDMNRLVLGGSKNQASEQSIAVEMPVERISKYIAFSFEFYFNNNRDTIVFDLNGRKNNEDYLFTQIEVNAEEISIFDQTFNQSIEKGKWHKITVEIDDINKWFYLYFDGNKLNELPFTYMESFNITNILVKNDCTTSITSPVFIDNVRISDLDIDFGDAVEKSKPIVDDFVENEKFEWDTVFPTLGVRGVGITWRSSDDSILSPEGVVTRKVGVEQSVIMTAVMTRENDKYEYPVTITIPQLSGNEIPTIEMFNEHVDGIDFSEFSSEEIFMVTKDIDLRSEYIEGNSAFYGGMDIEWSSSNPNIISNKGEVTPQLYDIGVKLTAIMTSKRVPEISAVKEFYVVVRAVGEELYSVDFENFTPNFMFYGESVEKDGVTYAKQWRSENERGESHIVVVDPEDVGKSIETANMCLKDYRYRTGSDGALQEIFQVMHPLPNETDVYSLSFDVKRDSSIRTSFNVIFGKLYIEVYPNSLRILTATSVDLPNGGLTDGKWHNITMVICPKSNIGYVLFDGIPVDADGKIAFEHLDSGLTNGVISAHITRKNLPSTVYFDNFKVRRIDNLPEEDINSVAATLSLPQTVEDRIELPVNLDKRTLVFWKSLNKDIIGDDGTVYQNGTATLLARVQRSGSIIEKKFTVNAVITSEKPYIISSFDIVEDKLTGLTLSDVGSLEGSVLTIYVYNQGELKAVRTVNDISSSVILEQSVDIAQYFDCRIEAVIKNNAQIVSNIKIEEKKR